MRNSVEHDHPPGPLIRWAGSKRRLIGQLEAMSPNSYNRYIEPFFGSGVLYFRLRPSVAVLGDINNDLINFYRFMRSSPRLVWNSAIRIGRTKEHYYRKRTTFAHELEPLKRAILFFYLNRLCFNGIYRTNKHGEFNVPFGSRTGQFPSLKDSIIAADALKGAQLTCGDFVATASQATTNDFVYLDPPYAHMSRRNRGEYGAGSFSSNDLERLSKCLSMIDSANARFLLSYADCPEIRFIGKKYHLKSILVQRSISVYPEGRVPVKEVLISNY